MFRRHQDQVKVRGESPARRSEPLIPDEEDFLALSTAPSDTQLVPVPAAVGYLVTELSFVTKDVEIVQGTQKFCTLVKTFKGGGGTSQTILVPNRPYTNLTDPLLT